MFVAHSILLFLLAGLCEIGGGYLVWQWWRNGTHWTVGLAGAVILFLYGIIPTYQAAHFGRVYAAYGGWFVVLSIMGVECGPCRTGSIRPHRRLNLFVRRGHDHVLASVKRPHPLLEESQLIRYAVGECLDGELLRFLQWSLVFEEGRCPHRL